MLIPKLFKTSSRLTAILGMLVMGAMLMSATLGATPVVSPHAIEAEQAAASPADSLLNQQQALNAKQEKRFVVLAKSLRCLECQNQSISDSGSPIAAQMRHELRFLVYNNLSDLEVGDWFNHKYGQKVSYTPFMTYQNAILWAAPFIMMFMVAFMVYRSIRSPKAITKKETAEIIKSE